ncbi:MAG: phage capsid protein [Hyphomicrobiaceae bacterium]
MTMEVSAHYRTLWDTQVRLRFQSRGNMLAGTVMPPVRISGEKMYFLRSGKLGSTQWGGRGHAVQRQSSTDDKVEITSQEWDTAYELYDQDKWKGVPAEEQARQMQASNALGTRIDRIIYAAVMAQSLPSDQIIGDYSTGLTPYMLKQAEAKLLQKYTPNDAGIYCPIPPWQYGRLETYKIFSSADWIGGDLPLTKRTKRRTYGSLNCFMFEQVHADDYTTSTQLRFRVWHRECVGAGHIAPEQMRHEWQREAEYKRWLVMHTLDGGATVIEPDGVVEFRVKADAAIEDEVQRTLAVA